MAEGGGRDDSYLADLFNIWEDTLQCAICIGSYKNPVALNCLHSFCKECIELMMKTLNTRKIACPTCRKTTFIYNKSQGADCLAKNWYIRDIYDKIRKTQAYLINRDEAGSTNGPVNIDRFAPCDEHSRANAPYCTVCAQCLQDLNTYFERAAKYAYIYDSGKKRYVPVIPYIEEANPSLQGMIEMAKRFGDESSTISKMFMMLPLDGKSTQRKMKLRPAEKKKCTANPSDAIRSLARGALHISYATTLAHELELISDQEPGEEMRSNTVANGHDPLLAESFVATNSQRELSCTQLQEAAAPASETREIVGDGHSGSLAPVSILRADNRNSSAQSFPYAGEEEDYETDDVLSDLQCNRDEEEFVKWLNRLDGSTRSRWPSHRRRGYSRRSQMYKERQNIEGGGSGSTSRYENSHRATPFTVPSLSTSHTREPSTNSSETQCPSHIKPSVSGASGSGGDATPSVDGPDGARGRQETELISVPKCTPMPRKTNTPRPVPKPRMSGFEQEGNDAFGNGDNLIAEATNATPQDAGEHKLGNAESLLHLLLNRRGTQSIGESHTESIKPSQGHNLANFNLDVAGQTELACDLMAELNVAVPNATSKLVVQKDVSQECSQRQVQTGEKLKTTVFVVLHHQNLNEKAEAPKLLDTAIGEEMWELVSEPLIAHKTARNINVYVKRECQNQKKCHTAAKVNANAVDTNHPPPDCEGASASSPVKRNVPTTALSSSTPTENNVGELGTRPKVRREQPVKPNEGDSKIGEELAGKTRNKKRGKATTKLGSKTKKTESETQPGWITWLLGKGDKKQ